MSVAYTAQFGFDRDGVYQRLDETGALTDGLPPGIEDADLVALYEWIRTLRIIDDRMLKLQRQGRISFYGPSTGQEAASLGTGCALRPDDWVFPALREEAILLLRGYDFAGYVAQCFGNAADRAKGRQMPCHFSSREHAFVSLSSPIANQLPQAVGAAMAAHLEGAGRVVAAYVGDGGTSEGDFHVAMRWAGQRRLPLVIVCQNNQWAISTPSAVQTRARSLAAKAPAYGMPGVRVDGNDVIACWDAMRHAADRAREGRGPTFVEALTYRVGAHSTSDDPSRYRDESVTERWRQRCPMLRLERLLRSRGLWDDAREQALVSERDAWVRATIAEQEAVGPPAPDTLFDDVYAELPPHLVAQRDGLRARLAVERAG